MDLLLSRRHHIRLRVRFGGGGLAGKASFGAAPVLSVLRRGLLREDGQ